MNKKFLLIILSFVLFVSVAISVIIFLSPYKPIPYEPEQPLRVEDIDSTQEGMQKVTNANNQFAFDLYYELNNELKNKSQNGNIFFSPYSIFSALAMTYEGAKGQTEYEMKSVMHLPEKNILRSNFAAIYNKINEKNTLYTLKTGNALWAQYDYIFLEDYIRRVKKYYGGNVANLDFAKETEKSRQIINSFIQKQTNGTIKDLIPVGILNGYTKLVLTNAIYFKGIWKWEFDKSKTRDLDFKITPLITVKTPMMYMEPSDKAKFNYADLEKMQILELPYKGEKISMLVLLPKQMENHDYTLEDIELSSEKLNEYKSQMKETKIDAIYLPKFELKNKYFMSGTLDKMGMTTAFTAGADFSDMDGKGGLFIKEVIHQAYTKVDEEGTEAGAATAVIMLKMAKISEKIFRADHPFIFIIQEKDTGTILFLGRVVDPTK